MYIHAFDVYAFEFRSFHMCGVYLVYECRCVRKESIYVVNNIHTYIYTYIHIYTHIGQGLISTEEAMYIYAYIHTYIHRQRIDIR
jgi:hypothetical protein